VSRLIKRKWEATLIRLAIYILRGRNVTRCLVVARRDNNDMYYMADKLDDVAERISKGYQ